MFAPPRQFNLANQLAAELAPPPIDRRPDRSSRPEISAIAKHQASLSNLSEPVFETDLAEVNDLGDLSNLVGSFSNLANNFNDLSTKPQGAILDQLCYGCGRCLSVCPLSIINTREHTYAPEVLLNQAIDAIEIHIQPWRLDEFKRLWQQLLPLIPQLKLVAISFPDCDHLKDYLLALLECMKPLPSQLIWQADGRPMSGDIGDGTTQAAIKLGQKVLGFDLPIGFVQIAGGTNATTAPKIRAAKIEVAGVAYGGYARKLIMAILEQGGDRLEANPLLLEQAVLSAKNLVAPTKINSGALVPGAANS
jgi:Fe-S-cluster-containing hydrogenase component 2